MKTTKQSPLSNPISLSTPPAKGTASDRANEQPSDQTTPWGFYFLMATLGLGLLLMLGMALFSL